MGEPIKKGKKLAALAAVWEILTPIYIFRDCDRRFINEISLLGDNAMDMLFYNIYFFF